MLEPLKGRVIIKRIEEAEQVRGGIIIPDAAKEKSQEGEVVAVPVAEDGSVRATRTRDEYLLTGDRVLFGKYAGAEIKYAGEDLLILREDEVICRVV
jgi:chaperonin GroES